MHDESLISTVEKCSELGLIVLNGCKYMNIISWPFVTVYKVAVSYEFIQSYFYGLVEYHLPSRQ